MLAAVAALAIICQRVLAALVAEPTEITEQALVVARQLTRGVAAVAAQIQVRQVVMVGQAL